jgi:hypothetical protein
MVRIRIEAKPTSVTSVAKILGRAAKARAHLYNTAHYVRPEGSAEIIFPVGRVREEF